jgi:hypothetical protein
VTASHSAGGAARQAVHSRLMEALTRFGFIAYGFMHVLVCWLALQIAWGGHPSNETDQPTAGGC